VKIDERLKFIVGPTNRGFVSIDMDVGANGRVDPIIEFEVDGVARLLI
jgi:hypothetical protein